MFPSIVRKYLNRLLEFKPRLILGFILFLISLVLTLYLGGCLFQPAPLTIAVALGIDEPIDIGVEQAIQGVEQYVQEVNQNGGINGKKVKVELFNDSNNPQKARQVAYQIAENSNALVVLGHNFSGTSMAAGEIYQQLGVPAISGVATNDKITQDNEWYFRTILKGSSQANFLAFYLKEVLGYSTVSLIYDAGEEYSNFLREAFQQKAQQHGITVKNRWDVAAANSDNSEELDGKIETIVEELTVAPPEDVGVIVVLILEDPAYKIIAAIKRQGLPYRFVGGNSFSSATFAKRFQNYPEERRTTGYFTNGVYSISPLTFDILGEKAQKFKSRYLQNYGREPSWVAATFYHAAKVAVTAFERAAVTGNLEVLEQERRQVRDAIAAMNSLETAVEGINEPIYFDSSGDIAQNVTMSVSVNNELVSAVEQLTPITVAKSKEELDAEILKNQIVKFGDQFLNRTDVVHIGIRPRKISHLDLVKKTCQLDFELWFRYSGLEIGRLQSRQTIEDIRFLNAIGDIELGEPIMQTRLKGQAMSIGVAYDLYQVSGTFKLDFLESDRNFEEHVLGISFINNQASRSHLIYVIDSLGLNSPTDFVEILHQDQVLNPGTGWKITQATFFQDSTKQETLGNPEMIISQGEDAQFSRFNLAMTIAQDKIILRRTMSRSGAIYLSVFAIILICYLIVQKRRSRFLASPRLWWLLRVAASLILLFSTEIILVKSLEQTIPTKYLELIILLFDTLWWVLPAYFLGEALEFFLWQPLVQKTGRPIPTLVNRMVLTVIYLLTFYCVVAHVFNRPLTSLLATSGLALTIIGLAIQINISNIFSGLAINLEQTFKVGDYIEVCDEGIKGYVTDITWRATHIETLSGNTVLIPNSAINDKTIINYMRPQTISQATIPFTLTQATDPDQVIETFKKAIATILDQHSKILLTEPYPEVLFGGTNSLGIVYELNFWYLPTDTNFEQIQHFVIQTVLNYLQEAHIELA